jgi:hypothetical protein
MNWGFDGRNVTGNTVYLTGETPETTPPPEKRKYSARPGPHPKKLRVGSPVHPAPTNESGAGGLALPLSREPHISAEEKKEKNYPREVYLDELRPRPLEKRKA